LSPENKSRGRAERISKFRKNTILLKSKNAKIGRFGVMNPFKTEIMPFQPSPPSIKKVSRLKKSALRSKSKKKLSKIGNSKSRSRSKRLKQISKQKRVLNKGKSILVSAENALKKDRNVDRVRINRRKKRANGKKLSSVIFLKSQSKKPFVMERNPVEQNNTQESLQVNERVDEYLFLMLDSMKPFNFNIRDLKPEYKNIKRLLKD
jgi:hypothetical protein